MRSKICGITRVEDALHAAHCGVDAVGLVFWEPSSRAVDVHQALELCSALPPLVMRVGLFMDAAPEWIAEVLDSVPLHLLQFHGSETVADCERWHRPYIKALAMAGVSSQAATAMMQRWRSASGFVLDGHGAGEAGGSGLRFDWSQVPACDRDKIIIAGGLTPANVGSALRESGARAVDVSSGVESAPGIKDAVLVQKFLEETARV